MPSDHGGLRNSPPRAGIRAGTQSFMVIERRAVIAAVLATGSGASDPNSILS